MGARSRFLNREGAKALRVEEACLTDSKNSSADSDDFRR